MDLSTLLERMSTDIASLSWMERLTGGLVATVLAMVIVAVVLILLLFTVNLMTKMLAEKETVKVNEVVTQQVEEVVEEADDKELIAVISSAIAESLGTSTSNIIVRNIIRTNSVDPAWAKAGRIEQMKNIH
ncbi:OadG family protein [Alkalithermobacter paradoxus]|uniref:Oxaloacetate decarboxylase gamma chain n=1 Tax=Alkalithermobacter paradoxus TaxID=29349 RepID=A0A1V4I4L8_9FIRM|nr:oxaloacetate decarboxylase gamma chain [[Clostridium] thermoalcaliphilum]